MVSQFENKTGIGTSNLCVHDLELSEGIVWVLLDFEQDNLVTPVRLSPTLWPVAVALNSASLPQLSQRNDCGGPVLPDHPPEVIHSVRQGPLGS